MEFVRSGVVVAALAALGAYVTSPATAGSVTLGFEDAAFVHGTQLLPEHYKQSHGVTITGYNDRTKGSLVVIFDSHTTVNTSDPDLVAPWQGGNAKDADLGKMLILQEGIKKKVNGKWVWVEDDVNPDGTVDDPDDEAKRPAGTFTFDFDTPITSFGLTIADAGDLESDDDYYLEFFQDTTSLQKIYLRQFASSNTMTGTLNDLIRAQYASTDDMAVFDDRFANTIKPVTAEMLGLGSGGTINRVVVGFGGSAAIGDITFTVVPSPTAGLAGLAMLGLLALRWRTHAG